MSAVISLEKVDRIKWEKPCAERFKAHRAKSEQSLRGLAEAVSALGVSCSHGLLQQYEDGTAQSITPQMLEAICQALDISIESIISVGWLPRNL